VKKDPKLAEDRLISGKLRAKAGRRPTGSMGNGQPPPTSISAGSHPPQLADNSASSPAKLAICARHRLMSAVWRARWA